MLLPDRARRQPPPTRSPSASAQRWRSPSSVRDTQIDLEASIGIAMFPPARAPTSRRSCSAPTSRCTSPSPSAPGDRDLRRRAGHQQPRPGSACSARCAARSTRASSSCTTSPRCMSSDGIGRGRRGTGALAAPDPRPGAARRVHPARRAVGPHAAAHRLRPRDGAGARSAEWCRDGLRDAGRRQRVDARPAGRAQFARRLGARLRRLRRTGRPADPGDHRAGADGRRRAEHPQRWTSSTHSACGSASTTSAPATRRWSCSSGCRSSEIKVDRSFVKRLGVRRRRARTTRRSCARSSTSVTRSD